MEAIETGRVQSECITDFARIMRDPSPSGGATGHGTRARLDLDPESAKNGLGQLVLTLVKLLHELLARQAIRRVDAGSLTDNEIERIGLTLMRQSEEIERLREQFGLKEEDLNLDLGPLGKLL